LYSTSAVFWEYNIIMFYRRLKANASDLTDGV
jgi:hypothetical protein